MKKLIYISLLFISQFSFCQTGFLGSDNTNYTLRNILLRSGHVQYIGTQSFESAVLEPTIVKDGDSVKIFYTGSTSDTINQVCVIKLNNINSVWPLGTPVIGRGLASPIDRSASSSDVVKDTGNHWYTYALDGYGFTGETKSIFVYTSTDGYNWVDGGLCLGIGTYLGDSIANFGNTCIVKDLSGTPVQIGGKYKMYVDGRVGGKWQTFLAESSSLTTGWTIIKHCTTLTTYTNAVYGDCSIIYYNGKYHNFYLYTQSNLDLPTSLAYAQSTDGQTWTIKEFDFIKYSDADPSNPAFPTAATVPFPHTDQAADVTVSEVNGKVYFLWVYGDNSYATGKVRFQIWMSVFNGSFADLLKLCNY